MGFFSCLGLGRRAAPRRRPVSRDNDTAASGTPAGSPPATANQWTEYRDAAGRPWWRSNLTGMWTDIKPHGNNNNHNMVFPFVQPPQQQVWPVGPIPGRFPQPPPWVVPAGPVVVVPVKPASPKKKEETKDDKKGHWEEFISDEGGKKFWRHTGTEEIRNSDPFT
ncbi:unnamed protein product [Ectocarpus sp. 12 AP-2014]